jgi:RNA polymerase sigma factor (sigma-70 family)
MRIARAPMSRLAAADDTVATAAGAAPAVAATFEELYRRHYRDVHRYLIGLTRSEPEADDLAAETFERALRSWGTDGLPHDRPVAWLLLTGRRLATDRWRRARRTAALRLWPGVRRIEDAGESRTEFWLWFDAVAAVLTDRQREVLLLRYQRDLTDADIGAVMGLSESGVRSLVGRALAVLRDHPELVS